MILVDIIKSDKKAIIDDEDYKLISEYTWRLQWSNRKGTAIYYASATIILNGFTWYGPSMHRILLGHQGKLVIDHIDGNGLNNQRDNLRVCTSAQNSRNHGKKRQDSASKDYKGIFFSKYHAAWGASVRQDGLQIHLGYFKTEFDAAMAYDIGASISYGEYARLNFPDCSDYPQELKANILKRLNGTLRTFTSQYAGVCYLSTAKGTKRWNAQIKYKSKSINLGSYITEYEAAEAYDIAIRYLGGDVRKCNFSNPCIDESLVTSVYALLDKGLQRHNLSREQGTGTMKLRYRRKTLTQSLDTSLITVPIIEQQESFTFEH